MQNDFQFSFQLSHVFQQKFITQTHNQKKNSWKALLMATFLIQLSNLPGNFMVYYAVAKIF